MGALLDSTYFIAAERNGLTAREAIDEARLLAPEELGLCVISVMELAHGEARADTLDRIQQRGSFLTDVMSSLPLYDITPNIARRAGLLDGDLAKRGTKLAFPDILIGTTALELGFSVITGNLRHFRMIPGLTVIEHHRPHSIASKRKP